MKYAVIRCNKCNKKFVCYAEDAKTIKKEGCHCGGEYVYVPESEWTSGNKMTMVMMELENVNQHKLAEILPKILSCIPENYHKDILKIIIQDYQLEV